MADHRPPLDAAPFDAVRDAVLTMAFRDDLVVREIPAPSGIAPEAFALAGDVRPEEHATDSPYGTGRLVVLHDSAEPDAWGGAWRIVAFAQAPLEPEIGIDPLLADVAWSWLMDALAARGAAFHSESGTSTKTLSTGFGTLAAEGDGAQIELRASWTPAGDITAHVDAWAELTCMLAGLPPGSEGVAWLGGRRGNRG